MNKVNLGDNYTHRVTLRLSEKQYDFLIKISDILGVSPSDYLRMTINSTMCATSSTIDNITNGNILERGEVGTNENVKANINNQL